MTAKTDGGPAFPRPAGDYNGTRHGNGAQVGISKRDYFAAKAMQAILPTITEFPDENWRIGVALDSYAMADAMLKAREEK